MNKRQFKKAYRKVVYPVIDEFNLITMDKEEREKAIKDFHDFAYKNYHYKRYHTKQRLLQRVCRGPSGYYFPVGKGVEKWYKETLSLTRSFNKKHVVKQSLSAVIKKQLPIVTIE